MLNHHRTVKKTFDYAGQKMTFETGRMAKQATGAVYASCNQTSLLATVVLGEERTDSFLPLTVNYQERFYAFGRLPGGFLKREGRPSDRETLNSRLIDRSVRPLFAKGFNREVQIVITVFSMDPSFEPDVLAIMAVTSALMLANAPFRCLLGAARLGYADGQYLLNPGEKALTKSNLDLLIAGHKDGIVMVEGGANQLDETVMFEALMHGHQEMKSAITHLEDFISEADKAGLVRSETWMPHEEDHDLIERVKSVIGDKIALAFQEKDKVRRTEALTEVNQRVTEDLGLEAADCAIDASTVRGIIKKIQSDTVRKRLFEGKPRIDGRGYDTVRDITTEVGLLAKTHGSALFTRGATQALGTITLASERDAQLLDEPAGFRRDTFLLHYNFPHYSVGECGFMGSPKRREIGHARLARRALQAVMPSLEKFPYVIRLVSEIMESNGSSSMATVCAGSLALMDAGVPILSPVAGIALGLIKGEGGLYVILTDILGDEDHLGDMDFKVAGTKQGITALQMDIKVDSISPEVMKEALEKARVARLHILEKMEESLHTPRDEIAPHAPHLVQFSIKPDKIRDVIGKGGATIRQMTEELGVVIDIEDSGLIKIFASDKQAIETAKARIVALTTDIEEGAIYEGPVVKLMDFGAFVSVLPGKDGFLHISEIANKRVNQVSDYLKEGQIVKVKVLEIDRRGRVRLSMKVLS